MSLTNREKRVVGSASRQAIKDNLSSLRSGMRWPNPVTNPYIRSNFERGWIGSGVNNGDLLSYVSHSVFIHQKDAWSYFGQAIDAYLKGRTNTALHMAYYSELRSAMSLMASEGIGIFNSDHFAFSGNSSGTISVVPIYSGNNGMGTHAALWEIFEAWAEKPSSQSLLLELFSVGGHSHMDWLVQLTSSNVFGFGTAKDLLLHWGLDLQRLNSKQSDRSYRNFASYRPSAYVMPDADSLPDGLAFVLKLWQGLNPDNGQNEFGLNYQILHRYVYKYFYTTSLTTTASGPWYSSPNLYNNPQKTKIEGMIRHFSLSPTEEAILQIFLSDSPKIAGFHVLNLAEGMSGVHDQGCLQEVLSRAFLLLDLCTRSCKELISSVGLTGSLQFWLDHLNKEHGLWLPGSTVLPLTDLWSDISDGVDDAKDWLDHNPGTTDRYKFLTDKPELLLPLSRMEMPALWGLGI
jgi:hypothetical protein